MWLDRPRDGLCEIFINYWFWFLEHAAGPGDLDLCAVCVAAQHHTNWSRFPWAAIKAMPEAHTRYWRRIQREARIECNHASLPYTYVQCNHARLPYTCTIHQANTINAQFDNQPVSSTVRLSIFNWRIHICVHIYNYWYTYISIVVSINENLLLLFVSDFSGVLIIS